MDQRALRTYLEHHLTGANAVTDVVRARRRRGDDDPWLAQFERELDVEAALLKDVAGSLDSDRVPHRVVGRAVSLAGRFALRFEAVTHDDDFRDLLEFEMIRVGVTGKQRLWLTLLEIADHPSLAGLDLDALLAQAERQADEAERRRSAAGRRAFGEPSDAPKSGAL